MEVDCKSDDDITSDLLLKFSCMNTTEKEVLVQQFRAVLGEKGQNTNAEFWLDMNNWNLESAVCSYYDFEAQNGGNSFLLKLPVSQFASDPSFCDRVPANTPFVFRCALTNAGDEQWPIGCALRFIGGTPMTNEERILLPNLQPGQTAEIHLSLLAPKVSGCFQCKWRPSTLTGQFFGEMIFIIINVTGAAGAASDGAESAVPVDLSSATEMMDDMFAAGGDSSMAGDSPSPTLPPSIVIPPATDDSPLSDSSPTPMGAQASTSSAAASSLLPQPPGTDPPPPTDSSMDAM